MPMWRASPVSVEPEVVLVSWSVVEAQTGERHFVGYCVRNRQGRVSSAIKSFNLQTRQGVTRSGRIYLLEGEPGRDADADYVWERWAAVNGVTSTRDVTHEFVQSRAGQE